MTEIDNIRVVDEIERDSHFVDKAKLKQIEYEGAVNRTLALIPNSDMNLGIISQFQFHSVNIKFEIRDQRESYFVCVPQRLQNILHFQIGIIVQILIYILTLCSSDEQVFNDFC